MRFALLLLFVAAISAAPLFRISEPIPGRYIVKIKPGIKVHSVLSSVRLAGGRVRSIYDTVLHGFSASLSDKALDIVLNLPAVEYVEEDGVVRAMGAPASWGLDRINQRNLPLDEAYNPSDDGSDVTIYVIDTGVYTDHSDFGGRATWGYRSSLSDVRDEDISGHGTHCAGTIAGNSFGVANGANIVAVKVLGGFLGTGSNSDVIDGVNWVAKDARGKLAVASMSLGGGRSIALDSAVEALIEGGVPTTIAAGNENQDACNVSPARIAKDTVAVSVGATKVDDSRWPDSNWGECVDIFAPGHDIESAWISRIRENDSRTNSISGTSMACPHVAGVIARALAKDPSLTPADLKTKVIAESSLWKVSDPKGSPNRLLFVAD